MSTAQSLSLWRRLVCLYQREIWQPAYLVDLSFRGHFYAAVRIISITITGLQATRAFVRDVLQNHRSQAITMLLVIALGAVCAAGDRDRRLETKTKSDRCAQ